MQKARWHKQGLILQLKGVDTVQQALALKNTFVFANQKLFRSAKGDNLYLCEVLDFAVFNAPKGSSQHLGRVCAFTHNGAQDLLQVRNQQGFVVEIPFIPEFILKIDFKAKKIYMHLPEGF